ncbi:hypothetical protein E2C01_077353 [Portunus trituberculatus]|uniref:Uncharacterized protein n=1 Tax=Portunus trituberculatus TaxID=210409 RepID=A0A5B7IR46_PORTR|nr:hypothetical protein [Portunus trituberculatus]
MVVVVVVVAEVSVVIVVVVITKQTSPNETQRELIQNYESLHSQQDKAPLREKWDARKGTRHTPATIIIQRTEEENNDPLKDTKLEADVPEVFTPFLLSPQRR